MLRSEITYNLKFVDLVKNYRVLYEYTNPGYGYKIEQEKAWVEIAKEMGGSVATVKERWRNLRLGLGRHLRQLKSNLPIRRPYYLAAKMDFLIPYTKSYLTTKTRKGRAGKSVQNSSVTAPSVDDELSKECSDADEQDGNDIKNGVEEDLKMDNNNINSQKEGTTPNTRSANQKIKNEQSNEEHQNNTNSQRTSCNNMQNDESATNESINQQQQTQQTDCPDLNFFRSILPDVRGMNPSQKAKFRIAVLTSLDRLLFGKNTNQTGNDEGNSISALSQRQSSVLSQRIQLE